MLLFIVSTRFMASSLSNLAKNVSEEIYKITKLKYGYDDKKCQICGIRWTDFLNREILKMIQ